MDSNQKERKALMCQIALEIPNEVLYETKMSQDDAAILARKVVALYYYEKNGVSLGYCAQIAGMDKEAFVKYLGENGISIFRFDDRKEFLEELNNA